ncbi:hypothetical protein [Natronobiforma cellulositropha]|uniref:hypothetical protein n=1 Tax=Natronobiforma cellulositropha TaxID=1679076 RepID=UPI0021D60CFB|nr:hypothetical protein [Natronobiforma cellulositropha]
MTNSSDTPPPSVRSYGRRLLRQAWRDTLSVYYANTPIWRTLKSGGLLVFGFFCWSAASLLLSYRPDWTVLWYVAAYGFLLIVWGPLTHAVIVPLVIRLRRTGEHPLTRAFTRHASKLNLTVFLAIVLVLGTFPVAPMTLDFQSGLTGDSSPDVDPDLLCTVSDDLITCHLSSDEGIDHIVVTSGGSHLEVVDDPPFAFEIRVDDLETVVGQQRFDVELRDEDGDRLRRYTRNADAIGTS